MVDRSSCLLLVYQQCLPVIMSNQSEICFYLATAIFFPILQVARFLSDNCDVMSRSFFLYTFSLISTCASISLFTSLLFNDKLFLGAPFRYLRILRTTSKCIRSGESIRKVEQLSPRVCDYISVLQLVIGTIFTPLPHQVQVDLLSCVMILCQHVRLAKLFLVDVDNTHFI